jgi:hypothetical protein
MNTLWRTSKTPPVGDKSTGGLLMMAGFQATLKSFQRLFM